MKEDIRAFRKNINCCFFFKADLSPKKGDTAIFFAQKEDLKLQPQPYGYQLITYVDNSEKSKKGVRPAKGGRSESFASALQIR